MILFLASANESIFTVEFWRWPITIAYVALILLISFYGLHRYFLVFHFHKHRKMTAAPKANFADRDLPYVTIQLPLFNEGTVAQRIIDTTCRMDYPAGKLQIQVLDDSTDGSQDIAHARCDYWRPQGCDIEFIHRSDRTGYKAGALANGMKTATGEFIAIFDADFLPPKAFLQKTIHYFTDENIGLIQTRWDHLNRKDSLLTRAQAIFLDGHFVIEHTARNRSGRWFNFSGTGGMWRVAAIQEAGGWSHDTLTEDMDLSYRAQIAGWNFLYLPDITCPAELPPEMNAFKSQQHRWTKGTIQVGLKMLPKIFASSAPFKCKSEAFFHLTSAMVYLYINLFVLLFYPAIALNLKGLGLTNTNTPTSTWLGILFGISLFAMGAMSATVFYITSQRVLKRSFWGTLAQVPLMMSLGIGIAVSNAFACLEALAGIESPFVRTPKYNMHAEDVEAAKLVANAPARSESHRETVNCIIPIPSLKKWIVPIELAFGVYMFACIYLALQHGWRTAICIPFLLIFGGGYLYVGLSSCGVYLRTWRQRRSSAPQKIAAPIQIKPKTQIKTAFPQPAPQPVSPSVSQHQVEAEVEVA